MSTDPPDLAGYINGLIADDGVGLDASARTVLDRLKIKIKEKTAHQATVIALRKQIEEEAKLFNNASIGADELALLLLELRKDPTSPAKARKRR